MSTNKLSPYNIGVTEISHKGTTVTSYLNNANFDAFYENIDKTFKYDVGYVPNGFEHRPDLISNVFYNTPAYWWLLMLVNNITDPFESFNAGDRILLPRL